MEGGTRLNIRTNPKAWLLFPVCLLTPCTVYLEAIVRAENPVMAAGFFVTLLTTLMLVRASVKETCRVPPIVVAIMVAVAIQILIDTQLLRVPGVSQDSLRSFQVASNIVILMQEVLQVPIVFSRPKIAEEGA
jgi:hypothetical protein